MVSTHLTIADNRLTVASIHSDDTQPKRKALTIARYIRDLRWLSDFCTMCVVQSKFDQRQAANCQSCSTGTTCTSDQTLSLCPTVSVMFSPVVHASNTRVGFQQRTRAVKHTPLNRSKHRRPQKRRKKQHGSPNTARHWPDRNNHIVFYYGILMQMCEKDVGQGQQVIAKHCQSHQERIMLLNSSWYLFDRYKTGFCSVYVIYLD